MSATIESFASELQAARKAKGWSQRELSARLHMPQAHLSRIERGMVDLKLSTMLELARMLEFDLIMVSRQNLNLANALLKTPGGTADQKPMYTLEDDE